MYMLVMVLDDSARLNDILEAWRDAGAAGVTIFESTGVNRVLRREEAQPAFAGFSQFFGSGRVGHNTIFTVIDNLALAERIVEATEAVVGDLNEPHRGIIFAMPVVQSWGVVDE